MGDKIMNCCLIAASGTYRRHPSSVSIILPSYTSLTSPEYLLPDISLTKMLPTDLVEVDSLEALVIIDNELDPLSPAAPPPPDTVQLTGHMGTLAVNSPHHVDNRGECHKEVQMEDICCSAHGLSILVVCMCSLVGRELY